jgi:4-hydroxy-3-polyprenylbenzoate decarboxylase
MITAYRDLHEFIEVLEKKGLLKRINAVVDPVLEITEITDRISKMDGPALLFENVKGASCPVLINAFGSFERMALSLGVNDLDEIAARISEMLQLQDNMPGGLWDKLKFLPQLAEIGSWMPKTVKSAPCQEVVLRGEEATLDIFPILQCWPGDGGRYITLPLVVTKDPQTGGRNLGMYRLQVFDGRTTGMHWHIFIIVACPIIAFYIHNFYYATPSFFNIPAGSTNNFFIPNEFEFIPKANPIS